MTLKERQDSQFANCESLKKLNVKTCKSKKRLVFLSDKEYKENIGLFSMINFYKNSIDKIFKQELLQLKGDKAGEFRKIIENEIMNFSKEELSEYEKYYLVNNLDKCKSMIKSSVV